MKGMEIETTNLREGGSHHEIGGVDYHFKPNDKGRHVCFVTNQAHAKRFLTIDGFEPYMGDDDDEGGDDVIVIDDDEVVSADPGAEGDDDQVSEGDGGEAGEKTGAAAESADLSEMTDEDLAKLHVETVGRPPHPNAKRETIEAKVKEAMGQAPAA